MDYVALVAEMRDPSKGLPIKLNYGQYFVQSFPHSFSGHDFVVYFSQKYDFSKQKALEIGNEMMKRHYFHSIGRDTTLYDDEYHYYRFLDDEDYRESLNTKHFILSESEPPNVLTARITQAIEAMYSEAVCENGYFVDYIALKRSDSFMKYLNLVNDLQRCNVVALTHMDKYAFFLNIANAMFLHGVIETLRCATPTTYLEYGTFSRMLSYVIAGKQYSHHDIVYGVLAANGSSHGDSYFDPSDPRHAMCLSVCDPRFYFALTFGTQGSPPLRIYKQESLDHDLQVTCASHIRSTTIVDDVNDIVHLSKLIHWSESDFGKNTYEVVAFVLKYVTSSTANVIRSIRLKDTFTIQYREFDWTSNQRGTSPHPPPLPSPPMTLSIKGISDSIEALLSWNQSQSSSSSSSSKNAPVPRRPKSLSAKTSSSTQTTHTTHTPIPSPNSLSGLPIAPPRRFVNTIEINSEDDPHVGFE